MTQQNNRKFTSLQVYNFVKAFLLDRYDTPVDIATIHREIWELASTGIKRIAIAAPRFHAKSTAITHALTLFLFLFRIKKYGIIVSDTESQASQFLVDIKTELEENDLLKRHFGVRKIVKDAVTDIIVEMDDGYKFRIQAKGAEQKVRGLKWRNQRPDWIIVDDLENDELVESDERREKLRNWFLKALLPALSKTGHLLVVGTILHMDSLLMSLMENKSWVTKLYKAHAGFDDFNDIIWPEQWSDRELRNIRQEYINTGNPEGYAQEWLNDPASHNEAYFKKEDFKPIEEDMVKLLTTNYCGVDLAISDKDKRAYTVLVVAGLDQFRRLLVKQVIRFRGDANDIIDTMLEVQRLHNIDLWKVEEGQIKLTLMGPLREKMNDRGIYLNISAGVPTKDKRSRARAIQARMRAGGVYFDKEAEWYPAFEQELLQFPKSTYKDQVDAIAWLGIAINELNEGPTSKQQALEDYLEQMETYEPVYIGRDSLTGY